MNDRDFAKLHDRLLQAEFADSPRWRDLSAKERTARRMLYDRGCSDGYDEGEKDGRAAWAGETGAVREAIERIETPEDTRLGHTDPAGWSNKRSQRASLAPRNESKDLERLRAQLAEREATIAERDATIAAREATIAELRKLGESLQEIAANIRKAAAPGPKVARLPPPGKR